MAKKYIVEDIDLMGIADAIRSKGGTSAALAFPDGFIGAIDDIETGEGGDTPTGTKEIIIIQNGTTSVDVTDYASAEITANVPNSYAAADEGKVVSNGALVAQTSDTVTENGTVDTTLINSLIVNVSGGSTPDDPLDFSGGNIMAIISHGTEYIVTDFTCEMEGIFATKLQDVNTTNYEHYWGLAYNANKLGLQRSGNTLQYMFGTTSGFLYSYPNYITGGLVTPYFCTMGFTSGTSNKPLAFFKGYHNGNLESQIATYTFYGLNILDVDYNYVARFVPWIDNGVACIKELISGSTYINNGTGAFDYIDLEGVTHTA